MFDFDIPTPTLIPAFTVVVQVGAPIEAGIVDGARKRIVPILGGSVYGPRLGGAVLPGGADWQTIRGDGAAAIWARYTLRADDGTTIGVINPGIRRGPAEVIAHLAEGREVDPARYYFRTAPIFEVASDSEHRWLSESIFICAAARHQNSVRLNVFQVE